MLKKNKIKKKKKKKSKKFVYLSDFRKEKKLLLNFKSSIICKIFLKNSQRINIVLLNNQYNKNLI